MATLPVNERRKPKKPVWTKETESSEDDFDDFDDEDDHSQISSRFDTMAEKDATMETDELSQESVENSIDAKRPSPKVDVSHQDAGWREADCERVSVDSIFVHKKRISSAVADASAMKTVEPSPMQEADWSDRLDHARQPRDSLFMYRSRKAHCDDDYVDRVARTPHKSMQKSVSTPNLSDKKHRECAKGLPFDKQPEIGASSMKQWLIAQIPSASKNRSSLRPPMLSSQKYHQPHLGRLESTPAMSASQRFRSEFEKENCPPFKALHAGDGRNSLLSNRFGLAFDSVSKPPARNLQLHGGQGVSWAPSPMPPPVHEYLRTPSQSSFGGRLKDHSKPTVMPPSVCASATTTAPVVAYHAAGADCLAVNLICYTGVKFIGRGGSCKVYQAMDPEFNMVAIKVVDLQGIDDEIAADHKNEVGVLARLQHSDRIVRLIDHEFKSCENTLYVVMEKGEADFGAYLRERSYKLHPVELRFFWMQMLTAVRDIHAEGIIHSDLKPGNFLVVKGQLKLIDFGIASSLRPEATKVTRVGKAGTYNFISPEAVSEKIYGDEEQPSIKIGIKSDVWSLGCILHLMGFGRAPFSHITKVSEKERAICNPLYQISIPPEGQTCDVDLEDVLKKCLVRNPVDRASTEELLAHPFLCPGVSKTPATAETALLTCRRTLRTLTPESKKLVLPRLAEESLRSLSPGSRRRVLSRFLAESSV